RRTGVVQVHHGALGAGGRLDGAGDEVLARLGQDDDGDIVRNAVFIDQLAHEVEVGLRSRGEADFYFLEADLDQLLEEAQLALHAHGLDQGLVAVAQVGAHPDRRRGDPAAGPGAFAEVLGKRDERLVFAGRIAEHRYLGHL